MPNPDGCVGFLSTILHQISSTNWNNNNNILKIKDRIGFFDFDQDKAENDEKYDYYELIVKINFLKEFIKARYILNNEGKVENFELSFK